MHAQRALVAGNWKMHKTIEEAVAFVEDFFALAPETGALDAVLFPPFTALRAVARKLRGRALGLGAQTMSEFYSGAYTGEISPPMIADAGATWVILGHSERRLYCGETDAGVNHKVHAALHYGLTPIVAVGEPAAEHAAGRAHTYVVAQARAAFAGITPENVARCVVAYEPIWAIGSGLACNPVQANAVMAGIRAAVPGLERTRILYGGSVKADNIASFVEQPHVDGALVGGASLDPRSFANLIAVTLGHALR